MRLFRHLLYKMGILPLALLFAVSLKPALASDGDPLSLASGPDAEVKAALLSKVEKGKYKDLLECMEFLKDPRDQKKFKEGLQKLDKFMLQHPDYSDGYFMRAMYLYYGVPGSKDYAKILDDLNSAIKFHSATTSESAYENTAAMYAWRAKIHKKRGNLQEAIQDVETAIEINPRDAIPPSAASPHDDHEHGYWGKKDFDAIVRKYPKDYRGYLFRAIYYYNYGILLKPKHYKLAIADLNKAIVLNPKCARAYYLLGEIMTQRLLFGRKTEQEYQKEARIRLRGLSPWNAYPEECKKIEVAYTVAIKTDPTMKEAYLARATLYLNTRKYFLAIEDYNKVIELDPNYGGAYHDRGLAYSNLGNYWKAIDDFTRAIDAKKKIFSKYNAFVNRAKAYANNNQFDESIKDYTKAAETHMGEVLILTSLSRFRVIYPEYNNLDDKALLARLHDKYFPTMALKGFSELMLKHTNKNFSNIALLEIYENRGDTYLRFSNYRKAIDDYRRCLRIWPDYTMDRWKYLFDVTNSKCYLDIETLVRQDKATYDFWMKCEYLTAKLNQESHSIQNIAIDCSSKTLNTMSSIAYDANGRVIWSHDVPSGWSKVIPDTVGETLYRGWCGN
jgi:tetratricopeptide (TPR) repeat protein